MKFAHHVMSIDNNKLKNTTNLSRPAVVVITQNEAQVFLIHLRESIIINNITVYIFNYILQIIVLRIYH